MNFTSYGIYGLELSPHGKSILPTAFLTLSLMGLHEHEDPHPTTCTAQPQREEVICPRSPHKPFPGPAMTPKFLNSWFWQLDHDAFKCITANIPCVINLSSRSTLNHSRIMTFLWEDSTSLQTWELGRKSRKSSQSCWENLRSYTGKQLSIKTKHGNCCLLLAISYPFIHLFSTIFSSSGTQRNNSLCPMSYG